MTMELGLRLRLARGYAIEPYELINILEQFGYAQGSPAAALAAAASAADHDSGHESDSDMEIATPPPSQNNNLHLQQRSPSTSSSSSTSSARRAPAGLVEIMQVETRNPHFHDTTKGDEHVQDMQLQGLKALYHSPVTPPALRAKLLRHMTEHLGCDVDPLTGEPPQERTYPPLADALNFPAFADALSAHSADMHQIGHAAQLDVMLADRAFSGAAATGPSGGHRRPRRKTRDHHHPRYQLQLQVPRRHHDFLDHGSPRSSSDGWETNL